VGRGEDTEAQSKAESLGARDELPLRLKQQDYHVRGAQWDVIAPGTAAIGERLEAISRLAETCFIGNDAAEAGRDEKAASIPPPARARLNAFAVFSASVSAIVKISDATHTDAKERGMNCICFASAILEGGDRILDARMLRSGGKDGVKSKGACWTKDERVGVLKVTMEALRRCFGEEGEAEGWERWTWDV
jgi:hypothetical protein